MNNEPPQQTPLPNPPPSFKQYLGDSVYADFQDGMIILTTENGDGASNTIACEPEVLAALDRYRNWLASL